MFLFRQGCDIARDSLFVFVSSGLCRIDLLFVVCWYVVCIRLYYVIQVGSENAIVFI